MTAAPGPTGGTAGLRDPILDSTTSTGDVTDKVHAANGPTAVEPEKIADLAPYRLGAAVGAVVGAAMGAVARVRAERLALAEDRRTVCGIAIATAQR